MASMKVSTVGVALAMYASLGPVSCWAFEVTTHAAMSSEAVAASSFTRIPSTSSVLKRLGVVDLDSVLGDSYLDIGQTLRRRTAGAIEEDVFEGVRRGSVVFPTSNSIAGWIARGAVREDDNTADTAGSDEPDGVFNRVFGHFFDPLLNRGLIVEVSLGSTAVDWALSSSASAGLGRKNHYKVSDAREAMWRALTLKARDSGGSFNDDVFPSDWSNVSKERLRAAYWATSFRALGDVVHLLQDMAQPQHTRNDAHSGFGCVLGSCLAGHASFFEKYLGARTIGENAFQLNESFRPPASEGAAILFVQPPLTFTGHPTPRFSSYSDYFASATGAGNDSGTGLANYSNRGFYSFGTNAGSALAELYPSPPPTGLGLGSVTISEPLLKDIAGEVVPGSITLKTGLVRDLAFPDRDHPGAHLTSYGLWDQFLKQKNVLFSGYTLNHYVYKQQANLLVPRAVAYSAGLIDYFFRGQLEVFPPDDGVFALIDHGDTESNCKETCGFKKVRVKVGNSTPSIEPSGGLSSTQSQSMQGGVLVAVAKYRLNTCYTTDLSGEFIDGTAEAKLDYAARCISETESIAVSEIKTSQNVPSCSSQSDCQTNSAPFTFDFEKPIPINATSLQLQIVYRGPLGNETDAVVVETVDTSEPTYFTYMNASDYIKVGGDVYTRAEINVPARADLRAIIAATRPDCIESNQLKEVCFQPLALDFPLKWGEAAATTPPANVIKLPNAKRFTRFAMLVPPEAPASINQSASTCVPKDTISITRRRVQKSYVPDAVGGYEDELEIDELLRPVRGVNSHYMTACVVIGDGNATAPSSARLLEPAASLSGADLEPIKVHNFKFGT